MRKFASLMGVWLACYTMVQASFDAERFPGPYCATRDVGERCCNGRKDECSLPIAQGRTKCYCDMFCELRPHNAKIDCCPDFHKFRYECGGVGVCQRGERKKQDCNDCVCVGSPSRGWQWSCTDHTCVNDPSLISKINSNHHVYGWTATNYSKFDGIKLKDAVSHFLGTLQPKAQVLRENPIRWLPTENLPRYFDARSKWRGYIQSPMDQGLCAASWAFSATGVASDRWAIQSKGVYPETMSVQQLISCNTFVRHSKVCKAGRMEDAWWWLMKQGAVKESCYPYACHKGTHNIACYSCHYPRCHDATNFRQKTTPVYRIAADEEAIMAEIVRNGPVQALMKVRPDFFLYESGIYRYTGQGENTDDYHSVRMIGWGEERDMKYWLVVNSWSSTWGEEGLFKIAKGTNESGIEGFVLAAGVQVKAHQLLNKRLRGSPRE